MPRKSRFAYAKSLGKKALRKTFLGFARKEKTLGNKRFIKKKENGTPYTFGYNKKFALAVLFFFGKAFFVSFQETKKGFAAAIRPLSVVY